MIRSKKKISSQNYGEAYELTVEEVNEVMLPENLQQFKYGPVLEGVVINYMEVMVIYQRDIVLHLDAVVHRKRWNVTCLDLILIRYARGTNGQLAY